MSEAVTVLSLMKMTSTVSEETFARHTHTHTHTHTRTHTRTHIHTSTPHPEHTHTQSLKTFKTNRRNEKEEKVFPLDNQLGSVKPFRINEVSGTIRVFVIALSDVRQWLKLMKPKNRPELPLPLNRRSACVIPAAEKKTIIDRNLPFHNLENRKNACVIPAAEKNPIIERNLPFHNRENRKQR